MLGEWDRARTQQVDVEAQMVAVLDELGLTELVTSIDGLSAVGAAAILAETGITTELSTSGGTSDGRFIAAICPQVIEFGPVNASIHKIDEHIELRYIDPLKNIYRRTLEQLLAVQ